MSVHRIASRYAKSLIELAQEQNKLERVKEDVDAFKSALQSREFHLLLKSPVISNSKKASIIKTLFDGKFDELTMAWLNILVNKSRERYLPEIAKEFQLQYKILNHITTVKVITAKPLSEEALKGIKAKLVASDVTDDKVEILTEVDPEIIGGFVIEFGDRMYDSSLKRKLDVLKKDFAGNLYTSQIISR